MLTSANADLALPLRIGQLFIGDLVEFQILGGINDARAHRKAKPVAICIAELLRN
ncbi:hypothetical protein D3C80_2176910 [compost metagenome]